MNSTCCSRRPLGRACYVCAPLESLDPYERALAVEGARELARGADEAPEWDSEDPRMLAYLETLAACVRAAARRVGRLAGRLRKRAKRARSARECRALVSGIETEASDGFAPFLAALGEVYGAPRETETSAEVRARLTRFTQCLEREVERVRGELAALDEAERARERTSPQHAYPTYPTRGL